MGPESTLASIAHRHFPTFRSKTTITAAGVATITFTATELGYIYLVISTAKVHVNTSTATTSHVWLVADQPQEFEPTTALPTLYLKGSGVAATVAIAKTGYAGG